MGARFPEGEKLVAGIARAAAARAVPAASHNPGWMENRGRLTSRSGRCKGSFGLKRVCVFCGSKAGNRPVYAEAAVKLARRIAERKLELVYGGATPGLMGLIADTALAAGGEVVGVIPDRMVTREIAHDGLTALHVVQSMHERKALMMDLADAFVALPGGYGTLDEVSDVATWCQLRLIEKPCGLLNVDGFFDPLTAYLDHAVREGFLKPEHRELVFAESDIEKLLDRLQDGGHPPVADKW